MPMPNHVPTVKESDIARIIQRDYGSYDSHEVWAILKDYRQQSYRVYSAALKQGNGDLDTLRKMIDRANRDFRDLLGSAEYPEQMRRGFNSGYDPDVATRDEQQYQDWFNR